MFVVNGRIYGVYKTFVRFDIELCVAVAYLSVDSVIDAYAVVFDQVVCSTVIARRFYELYQRQEFAEVLFYLFVVVYLNEHFTAVSFDHFDRLVVFGFLQHPAGYHLTVSHVSLFDIVTRYYAGELCKQTVCKICIVLCFVGVGVGQ